MHPDTGSSGDRLEWKSDPPGKQVRRLNQTSQHRLPSRMGRQSCIVYPVSTALENDKSNYKAHMVPESARGHPLTTDDLLEKYVPEEVC